MKEIRGWKKTMSKNEATYISFYHRCNTVRVFKKTMRALGSPKFIRFRVHENGRYMLLEPFDRISQNSTFRVPVNLEDENGNMDIHSKPFTRAIAKKMGWDITRSYRIPGEVYQSEKIVVFDLTKAVIITEDNSANAFTRLNAEQQNGDKK